MRRKTVSVLLALVMVLLAAVPALAYSDVTWSKDTTISQFSYDVDNAVVKAGVTVTMREYTPDPMALCIHKSLVVESGGKITGAGSIMIFEGATYKGIDFYYKVAGKETLLDPDDLAALIATDSEKRLVFNWDKSSGHFVLAGYAFDVDPFNIPPAGDGGDGGNAPAGDGDLRIAKQLEQLGLMKGAGKNADGSTNFALDRAPTRVEAVVLLIRLLGLEDEANAYDPAKCPFSDVPTWAKEELAFAYDKGLANGVGGGKFGTGAATVQQFLTFVLRAMDYKDSGDDPDFNWRSADVLALKNGLIGSEHDLENFTRGTCVRIMEAALRNSMKGGGRLWEKLVSEGVFTEEQYKSAMGSN